MKHAAPAVKSSSRTAAAPGLDSSSGENAAALAPPAYGIDFVDGALPTRLKAGIESLSGLDVSDVRVHANSDKPAQIDALAYAQGNDIHVAPGQESHLPHEAWHVVQQRQGRVTPTLQAGGVQINDNAELENEADGMGRRASEATAVVPAAPSPTRFANGNAVIQREADPSASVRLEDVQTLSDEALASEHEAVQAWVLVHGETDSAYAARLAYLQQLESEVSRRNPARIAAESRRRKLVGLVKTATPITAALGPMGALGPAQAAFLTEFSYGLKDGFAEQPAGRKDRLIARFATLYSPIGHWQDKLDYTLGYGKGIALGVWGEIEGIVDLILLLPRLQMRANEWLISQLGKLRNGDALLQKGRALYEELAGVASKAAEEIVEFFRDPVQAMKKLAGFLEDMLSAGLSKAYGLGQGAVEAAFRFLEKPFKELGEELGKIVGAVLFQVVLLVATDAIGNLIAKGAGAAARLGRALLEGAAEIFNGMKMLAGEFLALMRNLGRSLFKAFEGTMEALGRLIQRVEAFFAELAELSAPQRALAGGGKAPPGVFMSEGTKAAAKPARATMTTVEELRPAAHRGSGAKVEQRGKDILETFEEGQRKAAAERSYKPAKPGKVADEAAAEEAELLKRRGIEEGKPVDIRLAEAKEGQVFDVLEGQKYPSNQVPIRDKTGSLRRLDSYDPVKKEIISRKSLAASDGQIAFTDEFTMIEHFQEFPLKYPDGALIADVPAARKMGLAEKTLSGKYILEVPVQRWEIPERIIKEANARGVKIRDVLGKLYN